MRIVGKQDRWDVELDPGKAYRRARALEGRRLMRIAPLFGLFCAIGALAGCGGFPNMMASGPGQTVDFVSSNPDSVLLDFGVRPPGELTAANETASQQCRMFRRGNARLESLNIRNESTIRATYICGR